MISYIKGKIILLEYNVTILELDSGLGYEILIPFKVYEKLKDSSSEKVELFIYHFISDRSEKLFGFLTFKDRELFKLIRSLNGIGEMTALKILSYLNASELYDSVLKGDSSLLEKIPKVKGKTSEKILFEIKQNIKKLEMFLDDSSKMNNSTPLDITVLALMQLGFDEKTAKSEVEKILKKESIQDPSVLIKQVLSLTK
jgi:Holliday junction DNA helicase RuvA